MADVFISYKRENQNAVRWLVQGLHDSGISVWWDQDIAPDKPWEATIERELETAKVVVVAWSRAATASENVKAEARRARHLGKLVQTYVETCDPPMFFGERQGVNLSGWRGDRSDAAFQALLAAAQEIIAGNRPAQGVGNAPEGQSSRPATDLKWSTLVEEVVAAEAQYRAAHGSAYNKLKWSSGLAAPSAQVERDYLELATNGAQLALQLFEKIKQLRRLDNSVLVGFERARAKYNHTVTLEGKGGYVRDMLKVLRNALATAT